jgi:hypothetical protein
MVSRFTERDNVRDRARGQSASYAPTTRNQRREPNRFVQGVKNFGNDARQMGSDFSGALQNNPVTNTIQKGVNYGREKMLPGLVGAGLAGMKHVFNNQIMHGQNRNYFGGNMLHDKIPDNVRESMMTQKDQDFYDKYMMLAEREQDRTRKDEYLATAKTAKRNAQNTGRLNYALSQIDPDNEYINSAGLPSYSQDLFGEGQGRLNMDAFRDAMGIENLDMDITSQFDVERAREEGRAGKFPYSPNDFSSDVGENGNFLMEEGYTDIAAQNDINKLEGIIAGKYAEDNLPFDQKIGLPEGELNNDDKLALEAVLRSEEYQNAAKNLDYYKMKEMLDPYMDTDDMTSLLYGSN